MLFKIPFVFVGIGERREHGSLAAQKLRVIARVFGKALIRLFGTPQYFTDSFRPHALDISQAYCDIENQCIRRLLRYREVSFRFLASGQGFSTIDLGPRRESGKDERDNRKHANPIAQLLPPRLPREVNDLVDAEAQQPCHNLVFGKLLAVTFGASIGCDWFFRLATERAVPVDFETQSVRKTFVCCIARLAADDHWNYAMSAA